MNNDIHDQKVHTVVKWFSGLRGYGFLKAISPFDNNQLNTNVDIFLHFSVLHKYENQADYFPQQGDEISCSIVKRNKGYHVEQIYDIIKNNKGSSAPLLEICNCKIKWINPHKSFGFATTMDNSRDIFISGALLQKIGTLSPDTPVQVTVFNTDRGGEAKNIVLTHEVK